MRDRFPNLRFQLQDRSSFEHSIEYTNAGDAWVGGAFLVGIGAVLYNLISTIRAILENKYVGFDDFLDVFMSTEGGNPLFVALVYGPFVCIAVGVVAWLMKRATLRTSLDKTHQAYLSGGFLADIWQTAVEVPGAKKSQILVIYSPPGFPEETVVTFGNWVAAVYGDKTNPANKDLRKKIAKVPIIDTLPELATSIDPTFPQGLWLAQSEIENVALGMTGEAAYFAQTLRPIVVIPKSETKANAYHIQSSVMLG